ncbi:hypothetical protein NX801_26845 [Streptomyces sp. LP05-1]|uniref:Uncharacterized protein n=1 Tax=Streptomyces pyxinae TaxID=2970734 RepID=A0ABT2CPF7_9ACTN|nr:hypothetical protein [Streptomyces sp. LP05-1]MCS0639195.1 hypothetical protein [Streptomyces sp. LP05-1]
MHLVHGGGAVTVPYFRGEVFVERRLGPDVSAPCEYATRADLLGPVLALRWLHGRCQRVARVLEAERASAWVRPAGRYVEVPGPSCAARLLAWCEDEREQRQARERLRGGSGVAVVFSDSSHRVTLSLLACPGVSRGGLPAVPAGRPVRHRQRARRGTTGRWPLSRTARTALVTASAVTAYAGLVWGLIASRR